MAVVDISQFVLFVEHYWLGLAQHTLFTVKMLYFSIRACESFESYLMTM